MPGHRDPNLDDEDPRFETPLARAIVFLGMAMLFGVNAIFVMVWGVDWLDYLTAARARVVPPPHMQVLLWGYPVVLVGSLGYSLLKMQRRRGVRGALAALVPIAYFGMLALLID